MYKGVNANELNGQLKIYGEPAWWECANMVWNQLGHYYDWEWEIENVKMLIAMIALMLLWVVYYTRGPSWYASKDIQELKRTHKDGEYNFECSKTKLLLLVCCLQLPAFPGFPINVDTSPYVGTWPKGSVWCPPWWETTRLPIPSWGSLS